MAALDRVVAGITCREVLADLASLLEGTLPAAHVAQISAHLRDCRECERFGDHYARLVEAVRRHLAEPPEPDRGVRERLQARLEREYRTSGGR